MIRKIATTINPIENPDHKIPVSEIIRRTCDAGFKTLDFNFFAWVRNPTKSPFVMGDWRKWMQDATETAKLYGAIFDQTHAPIYNQFVYNPFYDDMTERCIEATAICGAKWMVIHAGYYAHDYRDEDIQKAKEANLRWLDKYVKLADRHNVGILLENKTDVYCTNIDHLIELVDAFDSERVKICFDTGHAHVGGYRQKEALMAIGDRLRGLHIDDNDGVSDSHLLPREGTIDWQAFIDGLDQIGFNGPLTFETSSGVRNVPKEKEDEGLRNMYLCGEWLNSLSRSEK